MFETLNKYKKQIDLVESLNKATSYIIEAHLNVKRKIRKGDIQINQKPDHIELDQHKDDPDHSKAVMNQKINEINERKNEMQKKLQQIQFQEERLKYEQRSSSVPNIHSHGYYRSKMSKHDLHKLKELMKKQDQYQKQLEQKAQNHEESIKKMEEEKQELMKKQKQEMFQQRKLQAQKNIETIKKRQQDRKKQMIDERQRLMKLKSERTVYEKMEKEWRKIQEQELRGRQQVKKILKDKKKVDFEDIKLHETKYNEMMNQNKQSRLKNSSILNPNKKSFYQSVFLSRVVEQDSRIKESVFDKKNMAKDFAEKKEQYAELVRKNFKPEIKEEDQDNEKNNIQNVKSMSVFEIRKRGNEYMKEVNTKVKQINPKKKEKKKDFKEAVAYHDYLTQRRLKKESSSQKTRKYQSEINLLMSKNTMSQEQKFYKAKLIAKRIESSPKNGKNPYKLIESINAKIQILKNVL